MAVTLTDLGCTEKDISVIKECLLASGNGPFFDEEEFHTLFGIVRSSIQGTLSDWPSADIEVLDNRLAIHNSMLNLHGYPHGYEDAWNDFLSVTREELDETFQRWKSKTEIFSDERGNAD